MGDNDSFLPRSEVVGGLGFSEVDWLGPFSTVEQQLPPTEGTISPKNGVGNYPFTLNQQVYSEEVLV
jgi:hypothetical protein